MPPTPARCTLCGLVLPYGWLPIPNEPNTAMLLRHLGACVEAITDDLVEGET